jgi:DNA repair exonuclease SbcCD nuclease subunit
MRLIAYSDMQASPANIEECEKAHGEVLTAINKYKPDAVIFAGDAKEALDPVYGIVTKHWINAARAISARAPFYALLGNHDLLSRSLHTDNWMDVLHAAGATTITTPTVVDLTVPIAFLPYDISLEAQKIQAQNLRIAMKSRAKGLLFFHNEIAGAHMGVRQTTGLSADDLCTSMYRACFGGHIHEHQKFGKNLFYIGSPFCMDWGEANQRKGILLIDVDGSDVAVKQLRTKIPHWYDFDYLYSTGKEPEEGAFIRIRVPVSTKKVTDELRQAETALLERFGNVNVFAVPEIEKRESDLEIIAKGASDEEMLAQYVGSTIPDAARFKVDDAIDYMKQTLPESEAEGVRALKFISTEGKNVLCFEHIKINYVNKGLVLLKGINRSWPRRSNGSGKTSALSLLTLAYSGENAKGQTKDAWASEFNDEPAELVQRIRSGSGKLFEVVRGRRPHKLSLAVDGADRSTGLIGTRKGETQGRFEALVGMSLKTLMNSVYIDQTVANGFLFGTQKDRMDLVAKLQNLARFEKALKTATDDAKAANQERDELLRKIEIGRERYSLLFKSYEAQTAETESSLIQSADDLQAEIDSLVKEHAGLVSHAQFYEDLQREIDDIESEIGTSRQELNNALAVLASVHDRSKKVSKLIDAGKCSMCGSEVGENLTTELSVLKLQRSVAVKASAKWNKAIETLRAKKQEAEHKLQKYQIKLRDVKRDLTMRREQLSEMETSLTQERDRVEAARKRKLHLQTELRTLRKTLRRNAKNYKRVSVRVEMFEYAKTAFHRNGIPLALSIALCPVLNTAADHFSEVFNAGKIRIRFAVVDGDFDVEVINTAGSAQTKGQSVGEAAMAGVICAFALREAAPRTNLLILDEPGHGLDAEGQKEFAQGLLEIAKSYETVIVTTHSQIIESILGEHATLWTIEKKNRVSRLIK